MKKLTLNFWLKSNFYFLIVILLLSSPWALWAHAQVPEGTGQEPKTQGVAETFPGGSSAAPDFPLRRPTINRRKQILVEKITENLEDRLSRHITLDVREMNVVDVLKFLALKGDFNLVTSSQVQGRATLYLKDVSIYDALDIILIANNLAYHLEHDIVHVMSAVEYEAMLGKKFNDKNIVEIIRLHYAKPSYVLATLESLKSGLGRIIIDEDTGSVVMIDTPQSIKKMKTAIDEMEAPFKEVVYQLQFAKADVVAEKLRSRIDENAVGTITVDERSNKLIVRAIPGRRKEVEILIKDLDTPTKEVLIEVRVLQVVFKPEYDFGIDWRLNFEDSSSIWLRRMNFRTIMLNDSGTSLSSDLATNYGRIGIGDIDVNKFETAIRALKQVSDTRILSNPKLLVTNNEEAKIHVGDTVPYIISTTSGTGDNAITSEDVRFVDVGLKLNVTPTISDNGFVSMSLKPEISTVTTSISSQGGGIPQVNKTLVETTVMVKDGFTIVLGGLRKDNKVHITKGIPFLMDIPFMGKLFRNESDSIEVTDTIIFITPHILTGAEDYRKYKGELKEASDYEFESKKDLMVSKPKRLELKK